MNQITRPARPTMTTDEFLAWPGDGTGRKFELVDGELRPMSPAMNTHGAIQARLAMLIGVAIEQAGLALDVFTEGAVVPGLRPSVNVRVPDIVVTSRDGWSPAVLVPGPILLVEILSPGNRRDTLGNVRSYMTIESAREIAVFEGDAVSCVIHRRGDDGGWAEPEPVDSGGCLRLASVALNVAIERAYPAQVR